MRACRRSIVAGGTAEIAAELLAYGPRNLYCSGMSSALSTRFCAAPKPADLPIERPSKFDFVVNLRPRPLGITIPPTLSLLVDQVLE